MRWASQIGSGIRSGVSSQAKPNIMPWSPAPWALSWSSPLLPVRTSSDLVTPTLMSGDCSSIETMTPQVLPSKPNDSRS